jgi:hypothetical protein
VQVWRRLQRLGAVLLRNSAYVLPNSTEAREDFEWIRRQIESEGGQATVLDARAPDAAVHDDIVALFRSSRARDYELLAAAGTRLLEHRPTRANGSPRQLPQAVRRLREQFEAIMRLDFFGAPERERVAAVLAQLDPSTRRGTMMSNDAANTLNVGDYRGKTWVTRPRPGVDRMSSAWLIRRFIDPDASFTFGEPAAAPSAIPFDTYNAEFGHHGAQCTFETLCTRFAISDSRARWLGHIVHDLDLKEDTHHEAAAATVGQLIEGLRRSYADDHALLAQGVAMFEALYLSAASTDRSPAPRRPRAKTKTHPSATHRLKPKKRARRRS